MNSKFNKIVMIQGTNGSGKSTVVHSILHNFKTEKIQSVPVVYKVNVQPLPIFVFGKYSTQCGGCDTIKNCSKILPILVDRYIQHGHILFEGLLLSGSWGVVPTYIEKLNNDFTVCFMNTSLKTCIERVNARRNSKGNDNITDTSNIESKYRATQNLIRKLNNKKIGRPGIVVKIISSHMDILNIFGIRADIKVHYVKKNKSSIKSFF